MLEKNTREPYQRKCDRCRKKYFPYFGTRRCPSCIKEDNAVNQNPCEHFKAILRSDYKFHIGHRIVCEECFYRLKAITQLEI